MRIAIIEFPGTNCERETAMAVQRAGMVPVHFRWNTDTKALRECDGFILAGGFSYEDRSRSGIIAAQDPIIDLLKAESEKGKPVLGICNGAQILLEAGMVPGIEGYESAAALARNRRIKDSVLLGTGFYNAWVDIANLEEKPGCAFTSEIPEDAVLHIPAAHAEGRFILPDALLEEMEQRGMILFKYVDEERRAALEFPHNPNGSAASAAGICNLNGNVLALMPHPERTPAGDLIFQSMRSYIERLADFTPQFLPTEFALKSGKLETYECPSDANEVIIEMIITDNAAVSVENALRQKGIAVSVRRRLHWEISFTPGSDAENKDRALQAAIGSGELFNDNKEFICRKIAPDDRSFSILTREYDDTVGEHTLNALHHWFGISGITTLERGVLWTITPDDPSRLEETAEAILATHILANTAAHRSMRYEQK